MPYVSVFSAEEDRLIKLPSDFRNIYYVVES